MLYKTLRVRVIIDPDFDQNKQYLAAFWHGKQYLPALEFVSFKQKAAILVSASKDGDILSICLKKLGYDIVRGSSRKNNIAALVSLGRKIKRGYSLGLAIDGPLGPIYKVKPGLCYMSKKFDVDILPVGSAFSRKWIFKKAWDQFELPKPFSKAILYVGKPLRITDDHTEQCSFWVEEKIQEAEGKALSYLNNEKK